MKTYIFTIHDSKANAYLPPFFLPEKGMATRTFMDCVNSEGHQFAAHPYDYTLFCLGTFDNITAKMYAETPQSLGNGVEFVKLTPDKENGEAQQISDETPIQPGTEG